MTKIHLTNLLTLSMLSASAIPLALSQTMRASRLSLSRFNPAPTIKAPRGTKAPTPPPSLSLSAYIKLLSSPAASSSSHATGRNMLRRLSPQDVPEWSSMWIENQYSSKMGSLLRSYKEVSPAAVYYPYYSHGLGNYIASEVGRSKGKGGEDRIGIIDTQASGGLAALGLLDYLCEYHEDLYRRLDYFIVEADPISKGDQESLLLPRHGGLVQYVDSSIDEWTGQVPGVSAEEALHRHWFVLGIELLDRLQHEKIHRDEEGTNLMQSRFVEGPGSQFEEITVPVTDPVLIEATRVYSTADGYLHKDGGGSSKLSVVMDALSHQGEASLRRLNSYCSFVPVGAYRLFNTIHTAIPNHQLILVDYDDLFSPPGLRLDHSLDPSGAPIVTVTPHDGNEGPYDHSSLLIHNRRAVDVHFLFPSDFSALQNIYAGITYKGSTVIKQGKLLSTYCPPSSLVKTRLRLGFNPMVTDYSNMSVLLS